jgi:16S rRNA (cytosine967-C5)-methyltransferase
MPREAALEILQSVLEDGRTLDGALEDGRRLTAMAPRDRAFARKLVFTTLRRLGQIDDVIDGFLDKPLARRGRGARRILRLGVCQMLFLATPPHAAVDTSVRLATGGALKPYRGLINAVLRRAARDGADIVGAQDAPRLNTPDWLWDAWTRTYGAETCRAIAQVHGAEPPLDLGLKADEAAWAERLGGARLPWGAVRLQASGAIGELPGYEEGAWWVQDAAAQLPVRLFGDVRGRRVLDLCAAPGGKTAQLLAGGAHVTAVDRSANRLRRLAGNLRRLGLAAETHAADGRNWRSGAAFDAVLVDAPCTATGTLRRHPDIAWTRGPEGVAALAPVQRDLLRAGAEQVKPGGILIFATCSLDPAEGPALIAEFLGGQPDFRRSAVGADELGGMGELIDSAGALRTLPCHLADRGGMDGFYACRLERR